MDLNEVDLEQLKKFIDQPILKREEGDYAELADENDKNGL